MNELLKDISFGADAKSKIFSGVDKSCNPPGSTMGAMGQLVAIETIGGLANVTKDGYRVVTSIHLEDPIESIVAELCKEASRKTVALAADSTTATAVLIQSFVKYSEQERKKGKSEIQIKKEIEDSREKIIEILAKNSIPVTDELLYQVALTSSNGDVEVARIVADAFIQAGEEGSVGCFRSENDETTLDFISGTLLDNGYSDENFINIFSDRTVRFDNNPLIVLSNINFKTWNQIAPFCEFAAANDRELVIVSEMEFQVQDVLLRNKINGKLKVAVVSPPSFGSKRRDFLNDLALIAGTSAITTLSGDNFHGRDAEFLGQLKSVTIGKSDTVLVPSENISREPVIGKIEELKLIIKCSENALEKTYLKERIAKLSGKTSIIRIGGLVPSEVEEKLDRAEDAVGSAKSAIEEGVCIGGGLALAKIVFDNDFDPVTSKALLAPLKKILSNAGIQIEFKADTAWNRFWDMIFGETSVISKSDVQNGIGYDVRRLKRVDMLSEGIVDSTKAIRNAYTNAVSVANTILRVNYVITHQRDSNGK